MPRVKLAKQNGAYFKSDLSARITQKMKEEKVRQKDLAADIGLSQPSVSNKIGTGVMTVEEFAHIAKRIHMTGDEIGELIAYWE